MGSESYKSLDYITADDIAATGISQDAADKLHRQLAGIIRNCGTGTPQTWHHISKNLLTPELPFSLHQMMYYGCYKDFGPDPPAWLPDPGCTNLTNVGKLLEEHGKEFLGSKYVDPITSFCNLQEFSVSNPEVYWKSLFGKMNISFSVAPGCILCEDPTYPGNPANNCLSLSAQRTLEDIAVIWRDEGDDEVPVKKVTLKELRKSVWLVAHAIETLELEKGSAIAIDMPMDVNSVVIYMAVVLAGYVVVCIADSFAMNEISTMLKLSKAKAIFTQDLIIHGGREPPLCRKVVDAQSPMAIVIPSRGSSFGMELRDKDISWQSFLKRANGSEEVEFVAVEQTIEAFTNILFSSGTTGC